MQLKVVLGGDGFPARRDPGHFGSGRGDGAGNRELLKALVVNPIVNPRS